jgi:integrase
MNMIASQTDIETLTLREAAERWLAQDRKPASQRTFASYVRTHIEPALGSVLVKEIRNGALREFAQALAAKNLSPKTIQEVLAAVKSIIASQVNGEGERLFPREWNSKFIGAKPIRDQKTPCATSEQVQSALGDCSGIDRAVIALLAGTGLRVGEMLALRLAPTEERTHWDAARGLIEVRTSIFDTVEQEPKTPSAVRTIELAASLNTFLVGFAAGRTSGYLFGNGTPPKLSTLREHLDKVLPGGFHSLRRHRASFLEDKECQPSISRYWMGHAIGNDVHQRYQQSFRNPARRREEAERVGMGVDLPR